MAPIDLLKAVTSDVFMAVVLLLLSLAPQAQAACTCQCVNGTLRPLCSSPMDLQPTNCMGFCPMTAPSLPSVTPTVPPLGTGVCEQARVCDRSGNCRSQRVCR